MVVLHGGGIPGHPHPGWAARLLVAGLLLVAWVLVTRVLDRRGKARRSGSDAPIGEPLVRRDRLPQLLAQKVADPALAERRQ